MPKPLWGVADLHAHPASHLAFGAMGEEGGNGIFWGRPGRDASSDTLEADLGHCDGHLHSGPDADLIRRKTRDLILTQLGQLTGCAHGKCGWPTFADWPKATDLFHEQMHISWIRRAYDGGLRFLVASVTESQVLSMLWHRAYAKPCPKPNKDDEVKAARSQLRFIREVADENASWMKVVLDAQDARDTISDNKLAVVLGLEMDSLDADDILALVAEEGVRQVVPIHLANNGFGGVAVYADLFNSANQFLHGEFFEVFEDLALQFRLGRPQRLHYISGDLASGGDLAKHGAMEPIDVSDEEYRRLQYGNNPKAGHRNQRGLNEKEFTRLMQAGLMLDLAHMSQESQEKALVAAERYDFPLMNSHSGFRGGHGDSERSMREQDGPLLARFGGVLGLGTDLGDDGRLLSLTDGEPIKRLTRADHAVSVSLQEPPEPTADLPASKLRVTLETGKDGLGGSGHNAFAILVTRNGYVRERELNQGQCWPANSKNAVDVLLPPELTVGDLASFGIRTSFVGGSSHAAWDVRKLKLDVALAGGETCCLLERSGDPWRIFNGAGEEWRTPLRTPDPIPADDAVSCLRVRVKTGQAALDKGLRASVEVTLASGAVPTVVLVAGQGCPAGSTCSQVIRMPPGTKREDLRSARVVASLGAHDEWDLAEIRFDVVSDPVTRWFELYQATLKTMGDRGVALGTDANGFASQVPFTAIPVPYPFQYPEDIAGDQPYQRKEMHQLKVNQKEYDFLRDGMANYGLLPDFLYALCQRADTEPEKEALRKLFHSAEEAVAMWEQVEKQAKIIPKP